MSRVSLNDAMRAAPPACRLPAILLAIALAAFQATAAAADADIQIVMVKGDVRITADGKESPAKAGATLALPSTVTTGRDGSTDLRQGDTTIGIGPSTRLEFPASATADGPVDRIVQPLGNAFYNVGPRGNRRLRVETPYLVAVIKGTQFSVTVEPDGGTISLHEGSLEILAPGVDASVMLSAGEMATRDRGDESIRVIPMREGATPASSSKDSKDSKEGSKDPDGPVVLGADGGVTKGSGSITPIDPADDKVTLDADLDADGLAVTRTGVDADVDLGAGKVDTGADAGVDLGVDTGVLDADAGVDAAADISAGTVDVGLEVLDTGIDAGLGGDSLIEADAGSAPEAEDSGGLLGGILRRVGL